MSEQAPVRIVLVENDHLIIESLLEGFKRQQISAEVLSTEHEFRGRLSDWKKDPPDVFVLGTWVRWTDPAPVMPTPTQDVIDGGYHRTAGLRMLKYLSAIPELRTKQTIIQGFDSDDARFEGHDMKRLGDNALFVDASRVGYERLGLLIRSLAMASR